MPALVITDLDSVDGRSPPRACLVAEGLRTSNAAIKHWFEDPAITPAMLIAAADDDKVKGLRRIAYQVPETPSDPCGRTFEDAFILANRPLFAADLQGPDLAEAAQECAKKCAKSEFALRHAIEVTGWTLPRYINEGLTWLLGFRTPEGLAAAPTTSPALGPTPRPAPAQTAVTS